MATITGYAGPTAPAIYEDRVEIRGYFTRRKALIMPGFGGTLKLSTAVTVEVYITAYDGTAKVGLVNADFLTKNLSKAGAAPTAITPTITEVGGGWYSFPFTTAHTDTPGILTISLAGIMFETQGWSWKVSTAVEDDVAAAVAAIQADTDDIQLKLTSHSGTAQSGDSTHIQLANTASIVDDFYNGQMVRLESGPGAGQNRIIYNYVGITRMAEVLRPWATASNPGATTVYSVGRADGPAMLDNGQVAYVANTGSVALVEGGGINFQSFDNAAITAAAFAPDAVDANALAADAVTEIQTGLATATDLAAVQAVVDAINTLTGSTLDLNIMAVYIEAQAARIRTTDVQARIPASLTGDGRMDANVGAMQANVITSGALDATAATEIANAILDAARTGHVAVGSVGEGIALAAALLQGNFYMDNVTNTSNGQTAARLRVFHTGSAAAAATSGGTGEGEFATFLVATTYSGPSQVTEHRVVQQ